MFKYKAVTSFNSVTKFPFIPHLCGGTEAQKRRSLLATRPAVTSAIWTICPCDLLMDKYKGALLRNQWFEGKEEVQGNQMIPLNIIQ